MSPFAPIRPRGPLDGPPPLPLGAGPDPGFCEPESAQLAGTEAFGGLGVLGGGGTGGFDGPNRSHGIERNGGPKVKPLSPLSTNVNVSFWTPANRSPNH